MKKNDYETVHDEDVYAIKLLCIIEILIAGYKTVKALFMGNTFVEGFEKSWLSGFGLGLFLFLLLLIVIFLIKWIPYACLKKLTVHNGIRREGTIVSEIEKRRAIKGVIHLSWKYVVRLDDGSEILSTRYTQQIIEKKCTVYVWGSWNVLTDFRF